MSRDNVILVCMITLFPDVTRVLYEKMAKGGKDDRYVAVLDDMSCSDCRHFKEKLCRGRGLRSVVEIIENCFLTRPTVHSRTMLSINGRLTEIKRGRTRRDPISVVFR